MQRLGQRSATVVIAGLCAAFVLALGMSAEAGASVSEKKLTKCATKSASKAITKALNKLYKTDDAADIVKVSDLSPDQVDAYQSAVQQLLTAQPPNPGATPKAVNLKATCQGKTAADFTYEVSIGGNVVSRGSQGDAVLKKGKWLLNPQNMCDNLAHSVTQAQLTFASACYAALGVQGNVCDPRNFETCGPPG